jgi:UDP-3-O-acyl-N-acetylglucosamine deacetylase
MVRTLREAVTASEVRVEPKETPGIEVNGVPADLDHVAKADVRVDLVSDRTRAFVVEHALGPLGLCGVTAARVEGVVDEWEFVRPEHRFCYAADLPPSSVVGHPHGLPNPALTAAVADAGVVGEERARTTVTEPVEHRTNGGDITLRPREYGSGVRFEATYGEAELVADVDPAGENDVALVDAVTSSTTPYLAPDDEEAVTHSVADLVSDVAVIGGVDDAVVEANLGGAYHALTVGVARKAHERGVVERREG